MGGGDDEDDDGGWPGESLLPSLPKMPNDSNSGRDWLDLLNDANSYLSLHLIFTYLFTFLVLRFIHKNYSRFVRARQLFSLELVHSISARTVMVTDLPKHLRGERALAVYFENMGLTVESVSLCREVNSLKHLLDRRTDALLKLEKAWTEYLGNPSNVETIDPSDNAVAPLIEIDGEQNPSDTYSARYVVPHQKRPTIRPGWFKPKTDALEYLEAKFKEADAAVQAKRKDGRFKASHVAFVTFEKMSSAVCVYSSRFHISQLTLCLANCITSRARASTPPVCDLSRARNSRYSVDEHDPLANSGKNETDSGPWLNASYLLFLGFPNRGPRQSSQLPRDQKDYAMVRPFNRLQRGDTGYCAECFTLCSHDFSERLIAVHI